MKNNRKTIVIPKRRMSSPLREFEAVLHRLAKLFLKIVTYFNVPYVDFHMLPM